MSLLQDKNNQVWLTALDSGVVMVKNNVATHINTQTNTDFPSNIIHSAIIGNNGEIWLSTSKGLAHYNSSNKKFTNPLLFDEKLKTSGIRTALFDSSGMLWISLENQGLYTIDVLNKKTITHYYNTSKSNISGLESSTFLKSFIDKEGRLWFFSIENNVSMYNPITHKFICYKTGNDLYSIGGELESFLAGKNGEIWIGANSGFIIYNPRLENFQHICHIPDSDSSLSNNFIRRMLKDSKGRTWITTNTALDIKEPNKNGFIHLFSTNSKNQLGINTKLINTLFCDKKGRVWLGTRNKGIYMFNETLGKFQKIPVYTTLKNGKEEAGLIYYNSNGELCLTYNEIIIVTLDEEKMVFNETDYLPFLRNEFLNAVVVLPQNKIFLGTYNSFYIYDFKTKKAKHYPYISGDVKSISNPEVNDAYIQNDSIIWIATANGLNKFNINNENFKYYFIEDGLPNQYVYNLLPEGGNYIWLSTNKGISQFNTTTDKFKNFDINDGLQSNEFNGLAAFTNGTDFYFGGVNGYNYFTPAKIKINTTPPSLYFTKLIINNKKINIGDESQLLSEPINNIKSINIPEGINNLTIDFVGLDFSAPQSITYFYSLIKSGISDSVQWIQLSNQRSINITNPEFGNYILKIKAINKDGFESETKQLEINILPPFYKTNWFILALIFLFLIIVFLIYRIRINSIKKQKQELETIIADRTHEIIKQKNEAEKQKEIIEIKNKEILDSIHYAKRIQLALLKSEEHSSKHLPEHFILFKPKDIVSGDFYWALEKQDFLYVTAADCTGHGVPGAFMSMLGIAFLNEINSVDEILTPAEILNKLREKIVENLATGDTADQKDGMDISLYRLNLKTYQMDWAGSNNPLWIVTENLNSYESFAKEKGATISIHKNHPDDKKGIIEIKPDKQFIGYNDILKPFTNQYLQLKKNDSVYIFTDGFADQFGGDKGKKFKYNSLKHLVLKTNPFPMEVQKNELNQAFENWRGKLEQIDDVCLIGLKI